MVTDEERDYMWAEFARDPRMKINLGIRRRLAPLVDNDGRLAELLHALLFSLPGSPVLYYGDEIGMGDNIYLGDRDSVRTPMQWSSDRNAGFSRADFAQLYLPPLMDPVFGYQACNVEAAIRDQGSFIHWMRRMLEVRKPASGVRYRRPSKSSTPTTQPSLAYLRTIGRRHRGLREQSFRDVRSRHSCRWSGTRASAGGALGRVPFPLIGDENLLSHPRPPRLLLVPAHTGGLTLDDVAQAGEVPPPYAQEQRTAEERGGRPARLPRERQLFGPREPRAAVRQRGEDEPPFASDDTAVTDAHHLRLTPLGDLHDIGRGERTDARVALEGRPDAFTRRGREADGFCVVHPFCVRSDVPDGVPDTLGRRCDVHSDLNGSHGPAN